jgi:hypothetical protein
MIWDPSSLGASGWPRAVLKTERPMRIVVQQKESGLYFKDVGAWVPNGAEAMDFVSSTSALDFCVLNKLTDVQIVLKFQEERYEIVLPVQRQSTRVPTRPSGAP